MINKFFKFLCFFLIIVLVNSCGIKTKILNNGFTTVPLNENFFKNKILFNKSILSKIDTNVVYVEHDMYTCHPNSFKKLKSLSYTNGNKSAMYKFYANGNVNYFSKDKNDSISNVNFNPNFSGQRGVFYQQKNKIYIDLFTIIGYGFGPSYNISKAQIKFKNDSLLIKRKFDKNSITVYIKQKLSQEKLKHKTQW